MKLTLEEWDASVGRHLQLIEAGAEICERHAQQLMGMPDWETKALERLQSAEGLLNRALVRLARARQMMENKPHVC
ncbi:MAG: hypothetical protein J2P55_01125 [Rhizobiales bacterium]|nr:hypothetical protein [Hyphomicrobiales bacterium]